MTHIQTLAVAALHVAHLDQLTGVGLLVMPPHDGDVYFGSESVNGADWRDANAQLHAIEWEVQDDDETGLPWIEEGVTADGRVVIALHGRNPICAAPLLGDMAESLAALRALALGKEL